MAEKITKEADENSSSLGVRYHYGFYGRFKKGIGKTQEFNLGISGQSYTSAFPRRDARFHLRGRSRAGIPESILASRTTRVLFMRVRSYTRRSNKPVAHEVNQCTRPVGTTRWRRAHRFWREIKVARPGDGEEPISTHGKSAKRAISSVPDERREEWYFAMKSGRIQEEFRPLRTSLPSDNLQHRRS